MPFNLPVFKTRALTAIVFAVVMLAGLLINGTGFILLFTIIHFGCWFEFITVMKKINPQRYVYFLFAGFFYITVPVIMMLMLGNPGSGYLLRATTADIHYRYSYILPCGVIFSIWINDTMAYIVGSFIGKTPFSKISPKKTWEGTIGGAVLCVLVISLLGSTFGMYPARDWFFIALLCAIFGTLGDLLESKLKRLANIKDSGSIMPGHGGFLDRFDSLLTATPAVWLYVYFMMK